MSRVGLVLGGGGVTGAGFQYAGILALEMATGWDAATAEVVVGTSGGAVVASMVRGHGVSVDSLVGSAQSPDEYADRLAGFLYRRRLPRRLGKWVRHGVVGGLRKPGVSMTLGGPAPYSPEGIVEWIEADFGHPDGGWPDKATIIVAYGVEDHARVPFGTEAAPDVDIADAVAASCAVPLVFQPHEIDGKLYVDGGVSSGTNLDLVLGSAEPLDLIIVLAPMAAEDRPGRRFYEGIFDRAGRDALSQEVEHVKEHWPDVDILSFVPPPRLLPVLRGNPLSPQAAVHSFFASLGTFRRQLAKRDVWEVVERHLGQRVG